MPVQPASAEDEHDRADAAAEHRREREDQQDVGDRGEDVVDPLEEVADLAAEEARRARRAAVPIRVASSGAEHADEDRHLGALDRLGQHVAAEPVAAEGQRLGALGVSVVWYFLRRARPIPCSAAPAGRRPRCRRSGPSAPAIGRGFARRPPGRGRWAARSARRPRACQSRATSAGGRRGDQQQEHGHDQQRDHADAVAAKAPPAARQTPSERPAAIAAAIGRTALIEHPRSAADGAALPPRGGVRLAAARRRSFQHHPRIDHLVEHVGRQVDRPSSSSPGRP